MRVLLGMACALMACGDPASVGALIDVVAPADLAVPVDQVKLFVGLPGQLPELAISPAGFAAHGREPITAATFQRDLSGATIDVLPIEVGGDARFVFAPGGDADRLSVVIAIGYSTGTDGRPVMTAAGAAYEVELSTEHLNVYPITLAPAFDPATGPAPVGATPPVEASVWGLRAGDTGRQCVYFHDPQAAAYAAPVFVIEDPADQDCDGALTGEPLECAADVFDAVAVPPAEPTCALVSTASFAGITYEVCRAGGPTCTDGTGPAVDGCGPGPFCLQMSVCDVCSNLAPAAMWGCLASLPVPTTTPAYSYFKLSAPYTVDAIDNTVVITDGEATYAAAGQLPGMGRCKSVEFATREGALINEVDLGHMQVAAAITNECDLTLKVVRGNMPPAQSAGETVLLAVGLEDGTGTALNSMLVPLEIKLVPAEGVGPSLTLVGGLATSDAVLRCLQQP